MNESSHQPHQEGDTPKKDELGIGGNVSDSVVVQGDRNVIQVGNSKPPVDEEKLKQLESRAIQFELKGDFFNARKTWYEIKRIDDKYPRVDVKIKELEWELHPKQKMEQHPQARKSLWTFSSVVFATVCFALTLLTSIPALYHLDANSNPYQTVQYEVVTYTLTPYHIPVTLTKVYTGVPKETFVVNTFTPAYTITPNMPCENKMGFDVATIDMTVPDGTEMKQGQKFLKTWKIRNIGSCTWTTSYKLIYVSGYKFSAEPVIFSDAIQPSKEVQSSVWFVAPVVKGEYKSFWGIASPDGEVFGKFFVKIIVK